MKKVLIIEDDKEQANMYQLAFTLGNFEFLTAGNGQEGIEKARTLKPDLILLDLLLDKEDGLDVLNTIKKDKDIQNIPVIILTNFSREEIIDQGLKMGAKEAIIKTDLMPKEIVERVRKYLP